MEKQQNDYRFLQGGGEMGELTRNFSWVETSVGPPDQWPQSLRTTVSNMLRSKFPMFLWWGKDMVQFYNDAYRPSLGYDGKHPSALGGRAKDTWQEIWPIVYPLMQQVETTGEATWMEDQLVPIYRNGQLETVYWTYSYSSVLDDDGNHAGILVTCMETTHSVIWKKNIEQSKGELLQLFQESPVAIATIGKGDDLPFEYVNSFYGILVGRQPEDLVGRPLLIALPELADQGFDKLLQEVISTRKPCLKSELPLDVLRNNRMEKIFVNFTYQPRIDAGGLVEGVLVVATDVTEQVRARKTLEESEKKYRNLFDSMDQGYCTLEIIFENDKCVDYRYIETNRNFEHHLGMTNALGKTIREIAPDIETKWFNFYGSVALTGVAIRIEEESRALNRWYEVYAIKVGLADERKVGVFFTDITKRKRSETLLKENQELLLAVFDASPNSLTVYEEIYDSEGHLEDFKFVIVNDFTIRTTGRGDLLGKRYSVEFPNVKQSGVLEMFKKVATTGIPADVELRYEGEGMHHWFRFIVNKVGNLLVVTTEDITARKEAERAIQESEAKFRLMAESTPVLIAVGDIDGNISYYNKAWSSITGKPVQELLQIGLSNIVYEDDRHRFTPLFLDAYAKKIPFTAEFRVLNASGELRWLMADWAPRFDTDDNFLGYVSACTDITQNIINQRELETAFEQIQLSKQAAELGTFDLNLIEGTMHWDDRCRTLFGINHQKPVTYEKDFVSGLHSDDRDRILEVINRAFDKSLSNGAYDVEYRTIGAEDGEIRWVRAKGKVYFDSSDKPLRFIGSVLDITEKVTAIQKIEDLVKSRTSELAQANDALQKANKELQRSNAHLEEFAYAASHDLKEPIRKINVFTTKLKNELSSQLIKSQVTDFARIESATDRMMSLIDDLLIYSHVTLEPHQKEPVNLNLIMKRVLEDLEVDIDDKDAAIDVANLPMVRGYGRQLQQLLQNLISNAVKYSREDVPLRIVVSSNSAVEEGRSYHVIIVQDNGIGFEAQYAQKIFQMFTRLHKKDQYSGTGVGLSIVKKVVENHDGFIKVESKLQEGSLFKVYLPD